MKPLNLEQLRAAVREGRIEWRRHVLQKLPSEGSNAVPSSMCCYTAAHQDCGKWQVRFCSLSHLVPRPPPKPEA